MQKLIVPFNGNDITEIEKTDGVISAFPWDALMPTINQFVRLRDDEVIDGLIVSDIDVKVKISRKKGRKRK